MAQPDSRQHVFEYGRRFADFRRNIAAFLSVAADDGKPVSRFVVRIVRVKHNTAHGTVEIDGIRYRAYIPPVWVKEHLDESGRLFPGTYKRYQAQTVQKARFKRFVPVYGNEDRPLVELG